VNDEAGPIIYSGIQDAQPDAAWAFILEQTFTEEQITEITNSGFYPLPPPAADGSEDVRPAVVNLGTDQVWRCPSWTMSRALAGRSGTVYTGVFQTGSVYPDSSSIPFCSSTNVCHEGDIEVVFGTIPNPSSAQAAVTAEVQARYKSFLRTSDPNADGLTTWITSESSDVNAINLGGTGAPPEDACTPDFFGSEIPYYYQEFGQ